MHPLQAINSVQLNSRSNAVETPVKTAPTFTKPLKPTERQADKPKKREKLSALCKTPPSVVRTRTGRGYHRGLFLGEGGFARCFQMKDESGQVYAAKTVAKASVKNEKTKTKLLSEIKIHKSMQHPNIVHFTDCFEDDVNVYILLEICPNQSLMDLLKTRKVVTEPEVRYFMIQVIGAVKYLHSRRVIHRDLKLGNVFFDPEMNLKIGDFGLATVLGPNNSRKYTICGTPNYIAPEVLGGKTTGHSFEVDVWAIGVMMFALLCGRPPFQSKDVQVIYERIKKTEYRFPTEKYPISKEAQQLISDLLSKDPMQRPTLDEVVEYDWFRSGPFPSRLTMESLRQEPKNIHMISKQESMINLSRAKASVGLNESHRNPVQILRSDLESEKPKSLLPHSLSPGDTKSKYREVTTALMKPLRSNRLIKSSLRASAEEGGSSAQDMILSREVLTTYSNIVSIEEKSTMRLDLSALPECKPPMLVSKWVDYSNKHGFSYQLSNNDIGVSFNNGETVLKSADSGQVWHITPNSQSGWSATNFDAFSHPPELKKDLETLEFFTKYMNANLCTISDKANTHREDTVFLRRYSRQSQFIMFELSDGSFQFNFKDHNKICLTQAGQVITHVSSSRKSETMPLIEVLKLGDFPGASDLDFASKLEQIKSALVEKKVI